MSSVLHVTKDCKLVTNEQFYHPSIIAPTYYIVVNSSNYRNSCNFIIGTDINVIQVSYCSCNESFHFDTKHDILAQ